MFLGYHFLRPGFAMGAPAARRKCVCVRQNARPFFSQDTRPKPVQREALELGNGSVSYAVGYSPDTYSSRSSISRDGTAGHCRAAVFKVLLGVHALQCY